MVEVVVICEGQTEEMFLKRVVAPALQGQRIFLKPQILKTSRDGRGGGVAFERLRLHARNSLRGDQECILSTFIDLYALDTGFPGYEEASRQADVFARVAVLEAELHEAVVAHVECRPQRFIPHIQPYEFEGLLFSDVSALASIDPEWGRFLDKLNRVRAEFESPEHINDGWATKPSRRLETILTPKYLKTKDGPRAGEAITLSAIERECRHFRGWMVKLRAIAV